MARYYCEIEMRVCGIPAIIRVTHFVHVKGSYSYNAPSDIDYYGFTELEYDICDRRGRLADWLERKVDGIRGERARLEEEILEKM